MPFEKGNIWSYKKGQISSFKGKHHTDEAKKKLSLSRIGKSTLSEQKLRELSERMKGNEYWKLSKISEQGKLSFSLKMKGKKLSEETKIKMSNAKKGIVLPHMRRRGKEHHNYKENALSRNKDYIRAKSIKRKALSLGISPLTKETIQLVYENNIKKYGTLTCYLCLNPVEFGKDDLEHKIPLCRGGSNELGNLDVSHSTCNSKKYNKTEEEYREVCH